MKTNILNDLIDILTKFISSIDYDLNILNNTFKSLPNWIKIFRFIAVNGYDVLNHKATMNDIVSLWNKMSLNEQENFINNVNDCIIDNELKDELFKTKIPLEKIVKALLELFQNFEKEHKIKLTNNLIYDIFSKDFFNWVIFLNEIKRNSIENITQSDYANILWNKLTFNEQENFVKDVNKCMQDYIKNNLKTITSDANKDDVLNKYAFADQRPEMVPEEPNNEIEEKLYKELKSFFAFNRAVSTDSVNILQNILQKNIYKDVIKMPQQSQVYRGMYVDENYIKKMLGTNNAITNNGVSVSSMLFEHEPNKLVSSWSLDLKTANDFSKVPPYEKIRIYSVVLTANVSDNPNKFITGPDGLYQVSGLRVFSHEKESIGLGNIEICKMVWKTKENSEISHTDMQSIIEILYDLKEDEFSNDEIIDIFKERLPNWIKVFSNILKHGYNILDNKNMMKQIADVWNSMTLSERKNFIDIMHQCIQQYEI